MTSFATASSKGARLTSDIQDVMHYIIVRRGDFQLYDRLYNAFGRASRCSGINGGGSLHTPTATTRLRHTKNAGIPLRLVGSHWDSWWWTVLTTSKPRVKRLSAG